MTALLRSQVFNDNAITKREFDENNWYSRKR